MNRIPLPNQACALRSYFPDSSVTLTGNHKLIWTHTVIPTPVSISYKLKMKYKRGNGVSVFVVKPIPLPLAEGKSRLPHVYSHEKQKLCLYYPKDKDKERKWSPDMYFVHTIIPWAVEWLEFYEYWLGTGKWLGGGIHPNEEKEEYDFGQVKKVES